ncbi:LysR substrate-binding domain-containing protein [Acinetobacter puyangensis]|uniref:LysR substrate-binding domain-containing protein n=1 Tax=Acinetobacter puyangensis TaxID=1096779 RepID=UPI003A4E39C4
MSLEIRWIEDLLTLEQVRSISKAAEQRCISQSAFTRRIQQLEQSVGFAILDRHSRYLEFTDAGQILLTTAKNIEHQLNETLALIHNMNKSNDITIRFAVVHSLSSAFFSNLIRLFPDTIHDFKTELMVANVDEGFRLLKEAACDFLICYSDQQKLKQINPNVLSFLKLGETEIVPVTLKNANGQNKYDIHQYFPLLTYSKHAYLHNLVDQLIVNRLNYRIAYETDNANNLKDFVLQGAGVAWLPKLTIKDELANNQVSIIEDNAFIIKQQIYIFRNKLSHEAHLKDMWNALK